MMKELFDTHDADNSYTLVLEEFKTMLVAAFHAVLPQGLLHGHIDEFSAAQPHAEAVAETPTKFNQQGRGHIVQSRRHMRTMSVDVIALEKGTTKLRRKARGLAKVITTPCNFLQLSTTFCKFRLTFDQH
jgi:hypothetical protein